MKQNHNVFGIYVFSRGSLIKYDAFIYMTRKKIFFFGTAPWTMGKGGQHHVIINFIFDAHIPFI